MFEAESTVTEKTKIQPKPFFSLKFRDHINLPENYDYEVEIAPDSYNSQQVLSYIKTLSMISFYFILQSF